MSRYYRDLLTDADRIHAFDNAIKKAVKADDVVVDLGCGLGTFGIFASRAGARRVFGIDSDPVIELARQIAERNGANIEFIAGDAREVDLPEPATLLVFEDFSTGLLDGPVRELLDNVSNRWMVDQYRIIPQRATLNLAPIQSAAARRKTLSSEILSERPYGLDLQPLMEQACKSMHLIRSPKETNLLARPKVVLDHDLMTSLPSCWSTHGDFELLLDGYFDGLCLWFDMMLDDAESYSNHPASSGFYGQLFFPTPERWSVQAGDRIRFKLGFEPTPIGGMWQSSFELLGASDNARAHWSSKTFTDSMTAV